MSNENHKYESSNNLLLQQTSSGTRETANMVNKSSLLLSSTNLAWSQPSGCVLVSPKPPVIKAQTTASSDVSSVASLPSSYNSPSISSTNELEQTSTDANLVDSSAQPTTTESFISVMDSLSSSFEKTNIAKDQNQTTNVGENNQPSSTEFVNPIYKEVDFHWFYQKNADNNDIWQPFSMFDSYNLEYAYRQGNLDCMIPTNGTRFDVCLRDRTRKPVYWDGPTTRVRRCTWFYKRDSDYLFVPYPEEIAEILETTYRECQTNNSWNRRVDFSSHDFAYFYSYNSVYHYSSETNQNEGWSAMMSDSNYQPKYLYRGVWTTNFNIERDERPQVDHLVFIIHGIGDFCDISFRKLVDVVDDFREITQDLLGSHYSHQPHIGRVEVLPISWHTALHTARLDSHLNMITLPSIPRMRTFTNDTILDALFYTSPTHSQIILNFVAKELNRLYALFLSRNSHFAGTIGLVGHSLGSLILFDLLSYQMPYHTAEHVYEQNQQYQQQQYQQQQIQSNELSQTQQPVTGGYFSCEQISFHPSCLFALGSPIPVFLSVRGIDYIDANFQLPTCKAFYNIFHPYDPIAYRLEPLINAEFAKLKPVLIPHHKGRKRFHLELRDSIARVGTDLKQKVMTSIKATINSIYGFARSHRASGDDEVTNEGQPAQHQTESTDDRLNEPKQPSTVLSPSATSTSLSSEQQPSVNVGSTDVANSVTQEDSTGLSRAESDRILSLNFGKLNSGRRIDYVLQERPIEIVNEYLFAIASHGCYWLSEDIALLMLRELYGQMGVMSQYHHSQVDEPVASVPCTDEPEQSVSS